MNTITFDYNGHNSAEFGIVMGGINISDETPLGLNRNVLRGELNRYRSSVNYMGTQWASPLQFEISFIKSPCEYPNQSDMIFTEYEVNLIAAWLTSPDYPVLLKMYDEDLESFTKYNYYGVFSDLQSQILNGDICGLTAIFDTNSPFAWTDVKDQLFEVAGVTVAQFKCNTAEYNREVYPMIHVIPHETNATTFSFKITASDDGNRVLDLRLPMIPVTIDCKNMMIYGDNGSNISFEEMGIADIGYLYWPRLYYGDNRFILATDADVAFSWQEPRKVGAY